MKVASNLKDFVYKSIESDILAGNLHSGDIINEKDLVEKYGVSKSPVRDALIALCADGILKSIPRYVYEIITYSVEGVYSMMQFRFVLESGFLSRKIDTLTERQLDELEPKLVYTMDFKVTPHMLRHTYITNLIYKGVDPKTVQYLAGHENSKTTMDIYAKVKYNKPEKLSSVVNAAFGLR